MFRKLRSQIVFRTDIFRKSTLGAPVFCKHLPAFLFCTLRQKGQNIKDATFTVKIDTISINLVFECVKIVEFNFNSHVILILFIAAQ